MRAKHTFFPIVVLGFGLLGLSPVVGSSVAFAAAAKNKVPAKVEATPAKAPSEPTEMDLEARAEAKRDEAIEKLQKIMEKVTGSQRATLLFRLAEKYEAKSRYQQLRAMQEWDKKLTAWDESGNRGKEPKLKSVPEYSQYELFRKEALGLYRKILKKYPRYQRKDEVYYNLGSSLYDSKSKRSKRQGMKMYWKLIKQFPNSSYTPDAWLQLGEHFFNSGGAKLKQAVRAYRAAAKTKKPRIYSFALYKLAWCDYNLGQYDKALKKFRQVIDYAKKQKESKATGKGELVERDRIQLMEESLSDMTRAYSHLDSVDDAFEYYRAEVGPEGAYKYLIRLSKLYNKEGKSEIEIRAYQTLNKLYPFHASAPENQSAIMGAYSELGKNDQVRVEVRRLIDLYSPHGVWAEKNAGNQAVLTQAFKVVESKLSDIVTGQHREAQQTKLVETYKLARDIYKEYLDKFTDTENSYKFRFFYAEILYELKEFDLAAVVYDQVAQLEGQYRKPAAYTAVLAWEKIASGVKETLGEKITEHRTRASKGKLKDLEKLEKLEKGKSYDPTDLSKPEVALAAACDHFVDVAPGDKEVVKLKFKSARLYYVHNHFSEAADRFGEIIDRWPEDPLGRLAAELIVESFNVRSDWSQLNTWSRKFRDNGRLMADAEFRKKINEFVEGASFNEVQLVYEPKEGPKEIADRYLAFAKEFPKSKYVLVGLFNSVINYDKANLLERAIDTADVILKDYRKFKLKKEDIEKSKREGSELPNPKIIREKALFLSASFYERLAEFEKSAALFEQYVSEFKKGSKRADAIFNAGIYREGLGDYDKAIANFKRYIKENSKEDDVPLLDWRIGTILERKKDYGGAYSHYSRYAKTWGKLAAERKLCATYKMTQALLKQGKTKDARRLYAGLVKSYKGLKSEDRVKPCALDAVATASFDMIEDDYLKFEKVSLSVSQRDLLKNFNRKTELLQGLEKKYIGVLSIGQGDFGIASLYRLGKMYQHFSNALVESPCPAALDDDQCGMYQAALQEKAFPLDDKAIEAFDKALAKAYELGLYNEWLMKTQDALINYEPGRFPMVREYELIASDSISEAPQLMEAN